MLDLGTLRIGIETDSHTAKAELDKIKKQTQETEEQTTNSTKKMGGAWQSFKGTLGALGITQLFSNIIGGISGLASEAFAAQDALAKFTSTMSFAGFDDAAIESAKQSIKEYADETVYDLETIVNTTAQLASNGVPNFEELTEAAGNLNSVAGGTPETFKSLALVLTQTAGAGKLTTENWNQLANAIPGASGVLQQALLENGAYIGNFREAMEKGEITSDEFNQALMKLGSEPVAVEAAKSVETMEGSVENLKTTVTTAFQKIIDTIGMSNITGFINGIADSVEGAVPFIKGMVGAFMDFLPVLENAAPLIAGMVSSFLAFQICSAVSGIINAAKVALDGMTVSQWLLNAAMSASPVMLVVALLSALTGALITLWNTNEGFRNAVTAAWNAISETASQVWGSVIGFLTVTVPNAINALVTNFSQLPSKIAGFLRNILGSVGSWAGSMASNAAKAARDFGNSLVNGLKSLPSRMLSIGRNIIQGLVNGIKGAARSVVNAVTGVVGGAINAAKNFLGIHSPSRVFAEIGKFTMEGFNVGIKKSLGKVIGEVERATEEVTKAFNPELGTVAIGASSALSFGDRVSGMLSRLSDKGSQAGSVDNRSTSTTNYNYYIGDTKVSTIDEASFAKEYVALMSRYGRMANT